MSSILDLVIYWLGLAAGFLYSLVRETGEALATGNTAGLTRIFVSLLVVYLSLLIIHRTIRMLWSTLVVLFRLALLALVVASGVYAYAHGLPATIDAAKGLVNHLVDQATASTTTLRNSYSAGTYLNSLYQHVRSAF